MQTAKGTFEVTITPQSHQEGIGDPSVARMAIAKVFSGDMISAGSGQMLAYRSSRSGSAGFVAMEIVPDSGTEHLTGIAGEMLLTNEQGLHFYEFRYPLPES